MSGVITNDGIMWDNAGVVVVAAGSWSLALVKELNGICHPSGQPVILLKPKGDGKKESDGVVWVADNTKTGFYGFPGSKRRGVYEGVVKVANHGVGVGFVYSLFV